MKRLGKRIITKQESIESYFQDVLSCKGCGACYDSTSSQIIWSGNYV